MEVGQEVDHPRLFDALFVFLSLSTRWCQCRRTQNEHVQPSRRRIVDPFRGKFADAVQAREVDPLGVDELVLGRGAQILDVFDEKGVGGGRLRQEHELSTARGELLGDLGPDAGCAAGEDDDFSVEWALAGRVHATGRVELEEREEGNCEDRGDDGASVVADGIGNAVGDDAEDEVDGHGGGRVGGFLAG